MNPHRLPELLGCEHELNFVNRLLRDFAEQHRAAAVGAVHITCSDECEREAAESFQHWFAESLLPELKSWSRSAFRTANLGARYEWGAIRIAEQHFATPAARQGFKLLAAKINAHVSVAESGGGERYGLMERYASPSLFCGALQALLEGQNYPAINDLREAFDSEGQPRLAMFRDPQQIDPRLRSLLAAVVNARLQARRAIVDIQDYAPTTPTLYLVLPCVTLNRKQRDTELVVGLYLADRRAAGGTVQYHGLGDDPTQYQLSRRSGMLRIEDDQLQQPREARDHRQEILKHWQRRRELETTPHKRLEELTALTAGKKHGHAQYANEMLRSLLWVLMELSPVPASILLFAKGIAGVHHLYRAHRLARGDDDRQSAKAILDECLEKIDSLPPGQASETVELLIEYFQPAGQV